MSTTFREHCDSQGVRPGAILNSVLDANSAVVLSIQEADAWSDARVCVALSWPSGMRYTITDSELPDWAVSCCSVVPRVGL